jgi:tripeptide aminopeptidase
VSDGRYTSSLAETIAPDLRERFLRYVRIDTQARFPRSASPSSPGQLELGALLVTELSALGMDDVHQDENGYVTATVPGAGPDAATIGLIAHLDTSPDAPAQGVTPVVHERYDGGVIELPRGSTRLAPESMPELCGKEGHDIITASGDTLLGADDKAGVASIMAACAHLVAHPELPRPRLRICFTPDEEIGEGATLFDIPGFGAQCAYTIDGSEIGELQDETFSAVEVIVRIRGVDVHPGQATGKLVSALRLAGRVVAALPPELAPETTSEREGFIHPVRLEASAASAELRLIVRDFDDELLDAHVALLERIAREVVESAPRAQLEFSARTQYRNMRTFLEEVPEVTEAAAQAIRAEGIEPLRTPIRGGTDGSRLSEMGLPTPNIFNGGHEYHSVREWVSLQDMAAAAAVLVRLAEVWATTSPDRRGRQPVGGARP